MNEQYKMPIGSDKIIVPIKNYVNQLRFESQLGPNEQNFTRKSQQLLFQIKNQPIQQLKLPNNQPLEKQLSFIYDEYRDQFIKNQYLNQELIQVIHSLKQMAEQLKQLKRANISNDLSKRKRRYAKDIQREYYCPIKNCKRGYGSVGSLTHHVRLKHNDFFLNGNYQAFIQEYIQKIENQEAKTLVQKDEKKQPEKNFGDKQV